MLFIVVVRKVLDERGLLFVFVSDELDDEDDEDGDDGDAQRLRFATDMFFFEQNDALSMLSSLMYDDESFVQSKGDIWILRHVVQALYTCTISQERGLKFAD